MLSTSSLLLKQSLVFRIYRSSKTFNMMDISNFRRDPTGGTAVSSPSMHILSFILITEGGTQVKSIIDVLLLLLYDLHTSFLDRKVSLYWCADLTPFTRTTERSLRSYCVVL